MAVGRYVQCILKAAIYAQICAYEVMKMKCIICSVLHACMFACVCVCVCVCEL